MLCFDLAVLPGQQAGPMQFLGSPHHHDVKATSFVFMN
jgi:hypothetical protein